MGLRAVIRYSCQSHSAWTGIVVTWTYTCEVSTMLYGQTRELMQCVDGVDGVCFALVLLGVVTSD